MGTRRVPRRGTTLRRTVVRANGLRFSRPRSERSGVGCKRGLASLFYLTNIFIPEFRISLDESLHEFNTLFIIQDH